MARDVAHVEIVGQDGRKYRAASTQPAVVPPCVGRPISRAAQVLEAKPGSARGSPLAARQHIRPCAASSRPSAIHAFSAGGGPSRDSSSALSKSGEGPHLPVPGERVEDEVDLLLRPVDQLAVCLRTCRSQFRFSPARASVAVSPTPLLDGPLERVGHTRSHSPVRPLHTLGAACPIASASEDAEPGELLGPSQLSGV